VNGRVTTQPPSRCPLEMCLVMRGGKDLANKEIRFQSLCQTVQQGWGSAEMAESGTNRHEVPCRHRHQRTTATFPALDGCGADSKALGKPFLGLAKGFADDLEHVAGDPPLGTPTTSQRCRRVPGRLPPSVVTGQPPTRTGRQFTMPGTELTFCSGTAAGSCRER
jgi:hypothetical protein